MTLEYRRVYGTGLKGARPKVYGTVCLAYLSSIASYPKKISSPHFLSYLSNGCLQRLANGPRLPKLGVTVLP